MKEEMKDIGALTPRVSPPAESSTWRSLAGVDRDAIPGRHLVWLEGRAFHTGVAWRRAGVALLGQHRDGPHGYSTEDVARAMQQLDMNVVDDATHWQPLPMDPPETRGEANPPPQGSAP